MTDKQDKLIERQQSHTLKLIFGPRISAGKMREMAGIPTLRQRRVELCDKFAEKAAKSSRFSHWFPLRNVGRQTRSTIKYQESFARCERLRNSPLFYFRRRLNGKPGKKYGKRNQFWRERLYLLPIKEACCILPYLLGQRQHVPGLHPCPYPRRKSNLHPEPSPLDTAIEID